MDTLKLTSFAMLIPLSWAISVDAYPQSLERSNLGPALTCNTTQHPDSVSEPQEEDVAAIHEALAAIEAPTSTAEHHDSHKSPTETCGLDLDPIEID